MLRVDLFLDARLAPVLWGLLIVTRQVSRVSSLHAYLVALLDHDVPWLWKRAPRDLLHRDLSPRHHDLRRRPAIDGMPSIWWGLKRYGRKTLDLQSTLRSRGVLWYQLHATAQIRPLWTWPTESKPFTRGLIGATS